MGLIIQISFSLLFSFFFLVQLVSVFGSAIVIEQVGVASVLRDGANNPYKNPRDFPGQRNARVLGPSFVERTVENEPFFRPTPTPTHSPGAGL